MNAKGQGEVCVAKSFGIERLEAEAIDPARARREERRLLRVAIVVGSTRPGRKGEAVARWVCEIAGSHGDAEFELVDIKDYDPPLLRDTPASTVWELRK